MFSNITSSKTPRHFKIQNGNMSPTITTQTTDSVSMLLEIRLKHIKLVVSAYKNLFSNDFLHWQKFHWSNRARTKTKKKSPCSFLCWCFCPSRFSPAHFRSHSAIKSHRLLVWRLAAVQVWPRPIILHVLAWHRARNCPLWLQEEHQATRRRWENTRTSDMLDFSSGSCPASQTPHHSALIMSLCATLQNPHPYVLTCDKIWNV